jgi:hypothetical protein
LQRGKKVYEFILENDPELKFKFPINNVVTLHDLYCSPTTVRVIKSKRMRWAGHVARMGERRGVYRALVGKPEGKKPLGKPRFR